MRLVVLQKLLKWLMMDHKRVVLISSLVGILVLTIFLVYNIIREPTYDEMLARIERLMMAGQDFNATYKVDYTGFFNGEHEFSEGVAYYEFSDDQVVWNNTLSSIEGTFYDLKPSELLDYMKLSILSEVEDYLNEIPCYLLNAQIIDEIPKNILMSDYNYIRILACFDKGSGYPLQYTLLVIGLDDAVEVTYNSLVRVSVESEPEPFDEDEILVILGVERNETGELPSDFNPLDFYNETEVPV